MELPCLYYRNPDDGQRTSEPLNVWLDCIASFASTRSSRNDEPMMREWTDRTGGSRKATVLAYVFGSIENRSTIHSARLVKIYVAVIWFLERRVVAKRQERRLKRSMLRSRGYVSNSAGVLSSQ